MSEIDDIRKLLEEGFQPHMILRKPTEDELCRRGLPACFGDSETRALPLRHPDGRKYMFYIRDPEAIAFAEKLVEEQNKIIGYDLCVYCSGIGTHTILGRAVSLDGVVENLRTLLGWNLSVSDYPHTFEVSLKIEIDDQATLDSSFEMVRKVVLALSLRNKLGFMVGQVSPGTRYKGQPFALKWGLPERNIYGLTRAQLAYVDQVFANPEARVAATALQSLYCQVSDDSIITIAWAAIEQIFGHQKAAHLLDSIELASLIDKVGTLDSILPDKRKRLLEVLKDPNRVASKSRNERIAQSISELNGEPLEDVYRKVRALSEERGSRVHALSDQSRSLADHLNFVEGVLWAIIERRVKGPNPFKIERQAGS